MNLHKLAVSGALALAVSAPLAQEASPIGLVLSPAGGGTLSATFQREVTGLFVDTFVFTPASVSGPVSVSLTPLSGPVNFLAALMNDEGFSFLPESGATSFAFQANVGTNVPLSLTVLGFAGNVDTLEAATGSYSGTVAAIPEPETYALMLGGLALLGALRRAGERSTSVEHKTSTSGQSLGSDWQLIADRG